MFAQGSVLWPMSPAKPFLSGPYHVRYAVHVCTSLGWNVGVGTVEIHTPGSNSNLLSVLKMFNKNSPACKSKALTIPVTSVIPSTEVGGGVLFKSE